MPTLALPGEVETLLGRSGRARRVLLEIDTGLERLGAPPERAGALARAIRSPLTVAGVYAHLHVPRGEDSAAYLRWQYARFTRAVDDIRAAGVAPGFAIAASTPVVLTTDEMYLDGVDVGRLLAGVEPLGGGAPEVDLDLRPALRSLTTRIVFCKEHERSDHLPFAPVDVEARRYGVVPIGLADGLGEVTAGEALVRGRRTRLLGDLSLEHARVDLTGIPDAEIGDEVVLLGSQGGETVAGRHAPETNGAPAGLAISVRATIPRVYV